MKRLALWIAAKVIMKLGPHAFDAQCGSAQDDRRIAIVRRSCGVGVGQLPQLDYKIRWTLLGHAASPHFMHTDPGCVSSSLKTCLQMVQTLARTPMRSLPMSASAIRLPYAQSTMPNGGVVTAPQPLPPGRCPLSK